MNEPDESIVPRLSAGVRLKFDDVRGHWVVLAPERVIIPDETALEVLRRCDGIASLSAIIDELAASFRKHQGGALPHNLLARIDHALKMAIGERGSARADALIGLVGIRRGLFPEAPAYEPDHHLGSVAE